MRFKTDIVAEIFKVVCPTATYDPLQGITESVFDAPGLFNTRGAFESDDRVRGHIGDTPFEASEVGRAYSTGSGKHSRSYVVFRGLFFHLDFRQRLNGVTLIDPERAESYQLGERDELKVVTLDHPAFEKEFKVHTSDESEARALLTPAMMEQLLALRRHAGKPVFLAFKDRRAYVGVHYGRTLFEPGVAQTTSKAAVREIAEHFALVETIVRELSVNARASAFEADDSLLRAPGVEPHALSRLAAETAGTLTTSDLWTMAGASIDDSAKDGDALAPRPERYPHPPGTRAGEPVDQLRAALRILGDAGDLAVRCAAGVERGARAERALVGVLRIGVGTDTAARAALARRLRGRRADALDDCGYGRRCALRARLDGLRPPRIRRREPHPHLPRLPSLSTGLSAPSVWACDTHQDRALHREVRGHACDESHGVAQSLPSRRPSGSRRS